MHGAAGLRRGGLCMAAIHTVCVFSFWYSCALPEHPCGSGSGSQMVSLSEGRNQNLCNSLSSFFDVCYAYFFEITVAVLDSAGNA